MALYLVQHGKSLPKDIDPERSLSEEGVSEVKRIAEVASGYRVEVQQIFHSGKRRAAQTAALFSTVLEPTRGVAEMSGLGPMDDVETLLPKLDAGSDVMLVGHLPFMERLVSRLTTGSPDYTVFKFQNGGIVCLDQQEGGRWHIQWALMPKVG